MTDAQLRRLFAWVASHGVDCYLNAEDGYIVVYTELVDMAGKWTRETDRVRTVRDARAVLGY